MTSKCSELPVQLEMYYLPIMYGVEFILGFLGNLVVILGYLLWMKKWKSINVYLFNLAVSDLVFFCTLPYLIHTYAWGQMGDMLPYICLSNRFILHFNLYSSILFMVWVSLDRFLLLLYPLREHILLKLKTAVCISAFSWLLVTVQVTPLMFFSYNDLKLNNWTHCRDFGSMKHKPEKHFTYSLVLTLTGYILPLLALCFSTYRITSFLRTQEDRFDQRSVSFHWPRRVTVMALLMFLVLYLPYHLMRNIYISADLVRMDASTLNCIKSLYILSRPVAFLHSVINPVFYFLMGDKFKELLLNGLRGLCVFPPTLNAVCLLPCRMCLSHEFSQRAAEMQSTSNSLGSTTEQQNSVGKKVF